MPIITGWVETDFGMITPRTGHVSWVLGGNHLALSGGIYSGEAVSGKYKKDFIYNRNMYSGHEEGAPFASHKERACAVQIDEDEVIIVGGRDGRGWDSVSRRREGSEDHLPPLLVGRSHHGCGVVELDDASKLLVVAGGYNENYKDLDSIEVLNLGSDNDEGWQVLETRIPQPLNSFKMETLRRKLYFIGGKDENNEANSDIFVFDPASNSFTTIQGFSGQAHWNQGMTKVQRSNFEKYCMN